MAKRCDKCNRVLPSETSACMCDIKVTRKKMKRRDLNDVQEILCTMLDHINDIELLAKGLIDWIAEIKAGE